VSQEYVIPSSEYKPPRKGISFSEAEQLLGGTLTAAAAISGTGKLATAGPLLKRVQVWVTAGLMALSGVTFGVMLGYSDDPPCGDSLFLKLLEDEDFWQSLDLDPTKFDCSPATTY
jgi:hypothetical protein